MDNLEDIKKELIKREPIFHHPDKFGITKEDILNQMADDFWEVGASGNIYTKDFVLITLLERYSDQDYKDEWEASDFSIREISKNNYLLTYALKQGGRLTRRATIWRKEFSEWKIFYHQGTVVDVCKNDKTHFTTERLKYSLLSGAHAHYLYMLDGNKEVRKFFPDGALSKEEVEKKISSKIKLYEEEGLPEFIIQENETNKFVGRCGMGPMDNGQVEIGYVLMPEFWGKGYATEAALAICRWAKNNSSINSLIALAPLEHERSHKVMEKIGMKYFKTDMAYGVECKFYKVSLDSIDE